MHFFLGALRVKLPSGFGFSLFYGVGSVCWPPLLGVLCLVHVLICSNVFSRFVIISLRKRELVDLIELSSCYHVAVNALFLFLAVPWFSLQFVIVAFSGHTHLIVGTSSANQSNIM